MKPTGSACMALMSGGLPKVFVPDKYQGIRIAKSDIFGLRAYVGCRAIFVN